MLGVSFRAERVLKTQRVCEELVALRGKERELRSSVDAKEREKEEWRKRVEELEGKVKEMETKKEKPVARKKTERTEDGQEQENAVREDVERIERALECYVRLLGDDAFEILVKRRGESKAHFIIHMLSDQSVSLRVVLHPSLSKLLRKRLEARLPVLSEKVIRARDLTEMVCRCYWIVCHTC